MAKLSYGWSSLHLHHKNENQNYASPEFASCHSYKCPCTLAFKDDGKMPKLLLEESTTMNFEEAGKEGRGEKEKEEEGY